MDRDPLFSVKNAFYIGAFNSAINEAADLDGLTEAQQIERDMLVYRSYIALGSHEIVIKEIRDSSPMALQAVKLFAQYSSKRISKDAALSTLAGWLADASCGRAPGLLTMAAVVQLCEGNPVEALRACHGGSSLEQMALCVQAYLAMDRVDKAEAAAKAMASVDDDATLSQLAAAWVGAALGGAKVQEAAYIYQELGDKYTWTPALRNGLAVCRMKQGAWEEAERELSEALAADAKDADSLANMVAVCLHLGKPATRYATQLRSLAPSHPLVARQEAAEAAFDRAMTAFA